MNKTQFNRFIEQGHLQGASRYAEYWFIYRNSPTKGLALDLGVGDSVLPLAIEERGMKVIATEIDKKCIKREENRGVKCVLVKDATLPFPDNHLDLVYSASSIEHFDPDNNQDVETIKEVRRVLKPNGLFIITIPVDRFYFENHYKNTKHPPEKIYSEYEYKMRFLHYFQEVKKDFLYPDVEFNDRNGLMAVLKKD